MAAAAGGKVEASGAVIPAAHAPMDENGDSARDRDRDNDEGETDDEDDDDEEEESEEEEAQ